MKILIIRHGDPDYSIDSLTPKGWREAELLSGRLEKMDIDDFYVSPMGRAKDTAKPTLAKLGKDIEILPWLEEFRGAIVSPFTGNIRISCDLPPYLWCDEEMYYNTDTCYETELMKTGNASQIYKETTEGIDTLLKKYGCIREGKHYKGGEDKTIALFCHCCLGITVFSYLLGISPVVAQHSFFIAPTSVTTLVQETDKKGFSHFRAVGIGDISHLYADNEPMSESGLYPKFEK